MAPFTCLPCDVQRKRCRDWSRTLRHKRDKMLVSCRVTLWRFFSFERLHFWRKKPRVVIWACLKHEMAKWQNGEMAKWRNGEMAKWRNGNIFQFSEGKKKCMSQMS